jgi:uncharacterized iron-regulated membrane protein
MVLLGAVSTLVIAVLMAATLGALLVTGRAWRRRRTPGQPGPAADALRRHPAGRARHGTEEGNPGPVVGPDDDPEFISSLEWLIRGGEPDDEP